MKKVMLLFLCFYMISVDAQTQSIVKTSPYKATVFLNGAQLFHTKSVSLSSGATDIIIEGIAPTIDPQSIQAGGIGNFTILDVQYRLFYPEPPVNTGKLPDAILKKIETVNDSLVEIGFLLTELNNSKDVINFQKTMMLNNKLLIGGGKTDSLPLFKDAVEFYNNKLNQLYDELLLADRKIYAITIESNRLNNRLQDLSNYYTQQNLPVVQNAAIPQIVISVVSNASTTAQIECNYIAQNAGWYASYDLRASEINMPIELNYKANIWQQTGIDWKNIKLTCSTGNPLMNNNLPVLATWYLDFYQQTAAYQNELSEIASMDAETDDKEKSLKDYMGAPMPSEATNASSFTAQNQTITNTEFEINLDYSIPSDGKGHIVAIQTTTLTTEYSYLIVPKIDLSAFLIAKITNWEGASLLPGNANIYFKNTYVGKTTLNPMTLEDTLQISMGRDKAIEVKRTQIEDKEIDKILSINNSKEMAYVIEIRNAKSTTIQFLLKDHIPIPINDAIKIENRQLNGGQFDEATGIVTWTTTIPSKQSQKIDFSFKITYPKNEILNSF